MVVGRLLSYWEGNFSGAKLNFGRVCDVKKISDPPYQVTRMKCPQNNSMFFQTISTSAVTIYIQKCIHPKRGGYQAKDQL